MAQCVDFRLKLTSVLRRHYMDEYVRIIGENVFPRERAGQKPRVGVAH